MENNHTGKHKYEDLIEERKHFDILKSVEDFDASQLKKTDTVEKLVLPNEEGSDCGRVMSFCVKLND